MSKTIPLTKGYETIVDDEDYQKLTQYKWYAQITAAGGVYAFRSSSKKLGPKRPIGMHRQILEANDNDLVDHIDHNGLNNLRSNIRLTDKRGNSCNRPKIKKPTSSRFKGVCYDKSRNCWEAYIKNYGRRKYLGRHKTEEAAAKAYDNAAVILFGHLSYLNFREENNNDIQT